MNKSQMINRMSKELMVTEESVRVFWESLFGIMEESLLNGNDVHIRGFGRLHVVNRPAKNFKNVTTGKLEKLEPQRTVSFKPGKGLKIALQNATMDAEADYEGRP